MNKYSEWIMEDVRQNLGLEADDVSRDNDINEMSKDEIFERILEWDGLIGYLETIKGWITEIYNVKL